MPYMKGPKHFYKKHDSKIPGGLCPYFFSTLASIILNEKQNDY